jgi:carbon-monoxide dehydrogenase iron sulfur subunit
VIQVDISKCTGCRRCETACTFFHTGRVNHHMARMKVLHLYEMGIDGPVVCQQCLERYCMVCPVNALTVGKLGQVVVSPTICTLCGACEKACPMGAVTKFNDIVFVCDLCGGNPRCVEACTEGALTFDPDHETHPSFTVLKTETHKMNPSEKRHHYIMKKALEVRKLWRKDIA